MKKYKKKILFLVNGLGLGNSIRSYAIIQRLISHNTEIQVITSGIGEWFFKDKKELSQLFINQQIKYAFNKKKLSAFNTILNSLKILKILKNNNKKIFNVIESYKPNLIIIDSVYVSRKIKNFSIPIIALNNSDYTKELYYQNKKIPFNVKSQFHLIELGDYFYHKYIPDLVISPTFETTEPKKITKNLIRVGPIFRKDLLKKNKLISQPINVLCMLSGSENSTKINFKKNNKNLNINVIGNIQNLSNKNFNKSINYVGKIINNIDYLNNADYCVVNAGFSALSEIFYLNIPSVIIPITNHAEQWTNANQLAKKKIALLANNDNYEEKINEIIDQDEKFRNNFKNIDTSIDGASQAVNIILNFLNKKN